ncbi:MAG: hypothetical protein SGJ24_15575 [Chloroflexota bacterium]|nr:hypothetical protein [Chloroflexota bacterium]
MISDNQATWQANVPLQRLCWQEGDLIYEMLVSGGSYDTGSGLDRNAMIAIAVSLQSARTTHLHKRIETSPRTSRARAGGRRSGWYGHRDGGVGASGSTLTHAYRRTDYFAHNVLIAVALGIMILFNPQTTFEGIVWDSNIRSILASCLNQEPHSLLQSIEI